MMDSGCRARLEVAHYPASFHPGFGPSVGIMLPPAVRPEPAPAGSTGGMISFLNRLVYRPGPVTPELPQLPQDVGKRILAFRGYGPPRPPPPPQPAREVVDAFQRALPRAKAKSRLQKWRRELDSDKKYGRG